MVVGIVLSCSLALASVKPVKKTELKKIEPKSDLLLSLDGKIFPQDALPDSCKSLLQGVKCEAQSYGRCHIESKKEGELIYNKSVFTGPEGDQQIEQSWEKDGHVQKAIVDAKVIGKLMQAEIKDGKIYYQVTDTKTNETKKTEDTAEENLVAPSTIMSYIRPHSAKIAAGQKVQIKVIAFERMESFTFNIKKVRDEKTLDGEPVQVLEMSPANIIVKALVSPMYFHIKTKTGEMFAFEGESAVRRKVGNSWKKMQVFTAYDYKVNATGNASVVAKSECDPTASFDPKNTEKCEIKQ